MACSKYQYVKKFQNKSYAMLETYMVIRIDGKSFTKFCQLHNFEKPNDISAINLMNDAAKYVCQQYSDIFLAYGQSDEYSFVLNKNTTFFARRIDKILSCIVSCFSAAYVKGWPNNFKTEMLEIPTFDGRIIQYPNSKCLMDYFKWRQVDCHINNLYNTTFWAMAKSGRSHQEVESILKKSNSGQKNQILFQQFGINYNNLEEIYRRGTIIRYKYKEQIQDNKLEKQQTKQQQGKQIKVQQKKVQQQYKKSNIKQQNVLKDEINGCKEQKQDKKQKKLKRQIKYCHDDMIKQQFWSTIDF